MLCAKAPGSRLYAPILAVLCLYIRDREAGVREGQRGKSLLLPKFDNISKRMSWDLNLGQRDSKSMAFPKPSYKDAQQSLLIK